MEKKRLVTLGFVFQIIIIAVIALFIYIFIFLYQGKVPHFFGYSFLRVISTSMEPEINKGDLIIVKKINSSKVKEGDIITFHSEDPYLHGVPNTHRVVLVGTDSENHFVFTTKGDANASNDYYLVHEKNLIGIYKSKVYGGTKIVKLIDFMRNRWAYFAIMVLPVVFFLILNIFFLVKYIINSGRKKGND